MLQCNPTSGNIKAGLTQMASKKWLDFIRVKLEEEGQAPEGLELVMDETSSEAIYEVLEVEESEGDICVELRDNFNGEHLYGSLNNLMFEKRYHRILLGMDPDELAYLAFFAAVREIQQAESEDRAFRLPHAAWILLANLVEPGGGNTLH